jgi:hypothetical protein
MRNEFARSSVVVVSGDQISADLAGEAAILNLKSGIYYSLNEMGATIWRLVHEPKTIEEIESFLIAEYDVEADRCASDVSVFVGALSAEGLVVVTQPTE